MIPVAARRRAMLAAEAVDTSSAREAAILGGIVRSVISCGRINAPWVSQYAADIIGSQGFNLANVDHSPPGMTETMMVVERFQASYSQPFPRLTFLYRPPCRSCSG